MNTIMNTKTLAAGTVVMAAVSSLYGQASSMDSTSTPAWLSKTFGETLPKALTDGKFSLNARLRYEHADQVGLKAADAFTVRTRFGFTTAPVNGFQAMIEGENTRVIGPRVNYNDTQGNNIGHTVVADP